jgi:hypothetical protein
MSTLSEIETAVDQLPHAEQEILLEHLARKLGARPPATEGSRAQRERWLQKLDDCGTTVLPARRGYHSRRSSTTSALSVADELLGFFGGPMRRSHGLTNSCGYSQQRKSSERKRPFLFCAVAIQVGISFLIPFPTLPEE